MPVRILVGAVALAGFTLSAATLPEQGPEVQMIVTSADHMMHHPAVLRPAEVAMADGTITGFVPLEPGRSLELYILVDDSADYSPEKKIAELRKFVLDQPAAVAIGVGYIHNGALRIAARPTTDHEFAARALREPAGAKIAGPWCALGDLIAAWPAKALRREVILVTNGIHDPAAGPPVTAEDAAADAQRAGVIVYALYNPASDYLLQDWAKADAGITSLASMAYETGGEAYFIGHAPPFSVAPFLADITEHLANQYLVKFRVAPRPAAGFQTIFIDPTGPERELMKPDKVWIP